MSVYYYLVSPELGEAVRIGQGNQGEMTSFYSGIPKAMEQVRSLLSRGRGDMFYLMNDLVDEEELSENYRVFETDGEVREPEEI